MIQKLQNEASRAFLPTENCCTRSYGDFQAEAHSQGINASDATPSCQSAPIQVRHIYLCIFSSIFKKHLKNQALKTQIVLLQILILLYVVFVYMTEESQS